jgi:hypothetical protein
MTTGIEMQDRCLMISRPFGARGNVAVYCAGKQASIIRNWFPVQVFPFRFPTPPPPSDAVTLQCKIGG